MALTGSRILLLVICLLVAQTGSQLHEFSHWQQDASIAAGSGQGDNAPGGDTPDGGCTLCLAQGGLGHAAVPALLRVPPVAVPIVEAIPDLLPRPAASTQWARARAPPQKA